jgi:hypothetical protein
MTLDPRLRVRALGGGANVIMPDFTPDTERRYYAIYPGRSDELSVIEIFYNRQRKQARLRFLSPTAFERWFYEKRLAA